MVENDFDKVDLFYDLLLTELNLLPNIHHNIIECSFNYDELLKIYFQIMVTFKFVFIFKYYQ